ncbi:MAG: hypothetical protein LQ339_003199 [Xanthoria mediterranea]|nr:MAG: hypothetical protein LQ339_003199 [Xanthoria mediterranea]
MAPQLPDELLSYLNESIKCRELQHQQTACLLTSDLFSLPNLVLHGTEATGKSLTISALLSAIDTPSAIIRSKECVTTRHLLERTLTEVQEALGDNAPPVDGRCESISAFVVQLQRLLEDQKKFILVFDNIDRQREAAPTLLPALARLGELIPNLTTVFIITFPRPHLFHKPGIPQIHFPPYTRAELFALIALSPLPLTPPPSASPPPNLPTFTQEDLDYLWPRFTTAVHDSLAQPASNTLPSLRTLCARLWPPFIAPILANHYTPREFSKLIVRNRHLFQSEDSLKHSIIPPANPPTEPQQPISLKKLSTTSASTLPPLPTHLLLTAYLASHTLPKHDTLLFSKYSTKRKRRGGGGTLAPRTPNKKTHVANTNRKISRIQMLGAQAFPLERMLAIYSALFRDYDGSSDDDDRNWRNDNGKRKRGNQGGEAEMLMQFTTLVGMGLIVRAGAAAASSDPLEGGGGKWRVNVGREYVRQVARGVRFDLDSYLLE